MNRADAGGPPSSTSPEFRSGPADPAHEPHRPDATHPADHAAAPTGAGQKMPWILLLGGILIYAALAVQSIDRKYVDFGDGNYLYISWRIAEGELLYQDIPSPQPPLLLFTGALLMQLSGGDATLVRYFQVFLHAATALLTAGIAWQLFRRKLLAAWAGVIYVFLPEGVWWAAGYQSEPLMIALQCLGLYLLLRAVERERPTWEIDAAGVITALTVFVNMTALPYLLLQWFFVGFSFRRFLGRYSAALIAPTAILFAAMWAYTNGAYIEHVFFRQVGTYPTESWLAFVSYALNKLLVDGGDILFYEGGYVFAAMAGILLTAALRRDEAPRARDYAVWWGVFSIGSIVFVSKGGTVEYIFTIGEPAVAVFSAFFLGWLVSRCFGADGWRDWLRSAPKLGAITLIVCLALPALVMKQTVLLYQTFSNAAGPRGVFELSAEDSNAATLFIRKYTAAADEIVAPPHYAFQAKRAISENMSSLFILFFAYHHDLKRLQAQTGEDYGLPNLGEPPGTYSTAGIEQLAQAFAENPAWHETYPAISQFLKTRAKIISGEIPLAVVNRNHQFFGVPLLHQAIRDYMTEIENQPELNNREENIVFLSREGASPSPRR